MDYKKDFIRLRNCFYCGYLMPQYCLDNGYENPVFISDDVSILYEIYSQFHYYKFASAIFAADGDDVMVNCGSSYMSIGALSLKRYDRINYDNVDAVFILKSEDVNSISSNPSLKKMKGDRIPLNKLLKNMERYVFAERPLYDFIRRNPSVKVITYSHPDMILNNDSTEFERFVADNYKNMFNFQRFSDVRFNPLKEFGYSDEDLSELLEVPQSDADSSGCTLLRDQKQKYFNVNDGLRVVNDQPSDYEHTIYCLGTCVCVGYAVEDRKSFPAQLQKVINENHSKYRVVNYSQFYNNRYQDIFYNLNSLECSEGDIVLICLNNAVLRDIPCFYARKIFERPHNYGEIYIDKYHLNENGYKILAERFFEFLSENQWFKHYSYDSKLIQSKYSSPILYGIPEWVNGTLKINTYKKEWEDYCYFLQRVCKKNDGYVGAIVMNCNPFTNGHKYLIKKASELVEVLYVFVVEEDRSRFPFKDRIELVKRGTADFKNVIVLPSGKFMISSLTFNEYFNKKNIQNKNIDPAMDVELFGKYIAPILNIKVRFAGSEPLDNITNQYNSTMKRILPKYGIEFVEIDRCEYDDQVISASRVRKAMESNNYGIIKNIVPPSTYEYLVKNTSFEKNILSEITELSTYIDFINTYREELLVFVTCKDTCTSQNDDITQNLLNNLHKLGLCKEIADLFRASYLAVIDGKDLVSEKYSGNQRLIYFYDLENRNITLISEGYNVKDSNCCEGKIIIDGINYSVEHRGLNFVVYNKMKREIWDSVCFDIYKKCKAYRNKYQTYLC